MSSERQQSSQTLHPGGTPVVRKTSSCTVPLPADHVAVKHQMAHDVAEEIIGGMPCREFFDAFMKLDSPRLPNVNNTLKKVKDDHFDQIPADGLEKHMYGKLVSRDVVTFTCFSAYIPKGHLHRERRVAATL